MSKLLILDDTILRNLQRRIKELFYFIDKEFWCGGLRIDQMELQIHLHDECWDLNEEEKFQLIESVLRIPPLKPPDQGIVAAYVFRGQLYFNRQQFKAALKDVKRAKKFSDPEKVDSTVLMYLTHLEVNIYLQLHDVRQAELILINSDQNLRKHLYFWIDYGLVLREKKYYAKAIEMLDKIIGLKNNWDSKYLDQLLLKLVLTSLYANKPAEACKYLTRITNVSKKEYSEAMINQYKDIHNTSWDHLKCDNLSRLEKVTVLVNKIMKSKCKVDSDEMVYQFISLYRQYFGDAYQAKKEVPYAEEMRMLIEPILLFKTKEVVNDNHTISLSSLCNLILFWKACSVHYFSNEELYLIDKKRLDIEEAFLCYHCVNIKDFLMFFIVYKDNHETTLFLTNNPISLQNFKRNKSEILIPREVRELIKHKKRLIVSLDHFEDISFASLTFENEFIVDKFEIVHEYCLESYFLAQIEDENRCNGCPLSMAILQYGPGVKEQKKLQNLFPNAYYGDSVYFLRKYSNSGIIHIISIAQGSKSENVNLQIPTGALMLSDGEFNANQVDTITSSSTRLVFLNGCSTALGNETNVGKIGFCYSFRKKGVPSVIGTLWKVNDDVACEFSKYFYLELLCGSSKSRALKTAMTKLRKKHPDPTDWAGWVLFGCASELSVLAKT